MGITIVNIIAILASPLVAVLVSAYLQKSKEKKDIKMRILAALISTRHTPVSEEAVRSLNLIDVVFSKDKAVRDLWHEYYEMLHNKGLDNETGHQTWQKKKLELIKEMAKAVGYGEEISHLDIDRVYIPVGLGKSWERNEELANEFLRVLKNTEALQLIMRRHPEAVE